MRLSSSCVISSTRSRIVSQFTDSYSFIHLILSHSLSSITFKKLQKGKCCLSKRKGVVWRIGEPETTGSESTCRFIRAWKTVGKQNVKNTFHQHANKSRGCFHFCLFVDRGFIYLTFISARIVELGRFEHQNPVGWAGPVEDAETVVGRVNVTAGRHDVPISPSNPGDLPQEKENKWNVRNWIH